MKVYKNPHLPVFLVVLINMLAFLLLSFLGGEPNLKMFISGAVLTLLILAGYLVIHVFKLGDNYIFLTVSLLVSLGCILLFRLSYQVGEKQLLWFVIGICAFFLSYVVYNLIRFWKKLFWGYFIFSVVLFLLTLTIGSEIKGAKNWIIIGGQSFQMSEIIRVSFIFSLACLFTNWENIKIGKLERFFSGKKGKELFIMMISYVHIGFLVLQSEWGVAVLFFLIYLTMLYIYEEADKSFLLINILIMSLGLLGGYFTTYHIKTRVTTWINPWEFIDTKGYQITQSLFAIAEGGLFGKGLGSGYPHLVPEVTSDFIFSAICEEMGIMGGLCVIMLYFLLVYRGIKIALMVKEGFDKAVALGITIMFAFQTFIIIGGVIKFIPLTGITLPFVSSGGSSLISSFIALGILQAISKKAKKDEIMEIRKNG